MKRVRILVAAFFLLAGPIGFASNCHGRFFNPITDVCWTCLFPLTLGAAELVPGNLPDPKNPKSPVCICPASILVRPGITMGFWEPIALVDVTRHPFCMVNLGGFEMNFGLHYGTGTVDASKSQHNHSFYYVHWYTLPLMKMLNLITDALCVEKGDFDIPFISEIDATWKNDELAFILNPEVALFSNPIAQSACAADSVAASTDLPIDKLFWCAGAHGTMYPLDGSVQAHVGGVQASTLLVERMTFKLHRLLLLSDSTPSLPGICMTKTRPILPKSRYRYQMVNPLPAVSFPNGCQPFGRTTALWGAWREFPVKGEDFGYLIWRKRNCCAG